VRFRKGAPWSLPVFECLSGEYVCPGDTIGGDFLECRQVSWAG
jgi:hypothetical protein